MHVEWTLSFTVCYQEDEDVPGDADEKKKDGTSDLAIKKYFEDEKSITNKVSCPDHGFLSVMEWKDINDLSWMGKVQAGIS